MKRIFTIITLCAFALGVQAQQPVPTDAEFGKIDQADLEMKSCDFEKDANAEVLIDKGKAYYDAMLNVALEVHHRIKIFNDAGKGYANFIIEYYSYGKGENIADLQAETINLVEGKPEVTKLDKKLIYTEPVDKYFSRLVFSMPNIKAGSIIDVKYARTNMNPVFLPSWSFQSIIPTRYSEYDTTTPEYFSFQSKSDFLFPYTQHSISSGTGYYIAFHNDRAYTSTIEKRVLVNVHSLNDEPFMNSVTDNLYHIYFNLIAYTSPYGFSFDLSNTWPKITENLLHEDDFGVQLRKNVKGEDEIIKKAKSFTTDDEKLAYIFNTVRDAMKWNEIDTWYTINGVGTAWNKKTGNSTEINLVLCHLLQKAGIDAALPMLVSTRKHGKVNPGYPYLSQFNRTVVYVPVDSAKSYILDASSKYNMYNETPYDFLNSYGFYVKDDDSSFNFSFLENRQLVRKAVFITAEIKSDGTMSGNAQINTTSYSKIDKSSAYKKDGEQKYIEALKENDNKLKISSIKMENMDVDSLPLVESINFDVNLNGSDDNYIYFNPNLFAALHKNPFLSETRRTNIDFGYPSSIVVSGVYKAPIGYKVDVLPKNINMIMPDKGISFKRIISQQDDNISVRYVIIYNKSVFFKENYADFHEFYKRMYELLNEQIVLKKT